MGPSVKDCMIGIYTNRLEASKAHRRFVNEARRAFRKTGRQVPDGCIPPTVVGAEPLPFQVPPTFEEAFRYRGNLHFLQCGYTARRQFGCSDGGDDLPSDESLWSWFLHHPVVSPHLPESRYPSLYGGFPSESQRPTLDEIMTGRTGLPVCHCLLLDRRDRRAYVSQRDQTIILFALMEPEDGDNHNVFVDGLLMSPGSESYKLPPAPELLEEFHRFLDSQVLGPPRRLTRADAPDGAGRGRS